ncbi:MAG: hypothetical protein ACP5IE_03350 [Infirmifilum sp.]
MIKLNAFITVEPYFRSFPVFRIPLVSDSQSRFQLARILSDREVSYAYPYEEYLYFKGKRDETLSVIEELVAQDVTRGKLVLGSQPERLNLTVQDAVIIKPMLYQAFEKVLESKGFRVPRRMVKRAFPGVDEENKKRGLITPLTNVVAVSRGLRYMFEVRPSGYGILWLDIYSPPLSLQDMKLLSPVEIKSLNLMDVYRGEAVLKPRDRLNMLLYIINILLDDTRKIMLKFPDGDIVKFSSEPVQLEAIERW